jgi:pimeloyl-ACP methyl ester carboxylesterase
MSVILLKNKMMHYEVLGRGKPLIFLHGWVGSWRYWVPTLQAASANYRAYAIDMWGFGDTAKDGNDYSITQQADLLDGFFDQMGIGRIALIGHGLGALVAINYAVTHMDLVDRVMVISYPMTQESMAARLKTETPADLAESLISHNAITEPVFVEAARADQRALSESFNNVPAGNIWGIWERLTIPCLMVNGQNDPLIPAPSLDEIQNMPENLHAILFEESGHFPMLDEANKFNRLMIDFLALKSGESPRNLQLKEEWKRRFR